MSDAVETPAETEKGPRAEARRCVELLERIVSFMDARQRAVKSGLAPVPFLEGVGLNVIDAAGQFTVMVERLRDAWGEAGLRPSEDLLRADDILQGVLGRDPLPWHGGLTATEAEMRRLRSALERARGELTGETGDSQQRSGSGPGVAKGGAAVTDSRAAYPPPCPPLQGGREKTEDQTRRSPVGLPGRPPPQGGREKTEDQRELVQAVRYETPRQAYGRFCYEGIMQGKRHRSLLAEAKDRGWTDSDDVHVIRRAADRYVRDNPGLTPLPPARRGPRPRRKRRPEMD